MLKALLSLKEWLSLLARSEEVRNESAATIGSCGGSPSLRVERERRRSHDDCAWRETGAVELPRTHVTWRRAILEYRAPGTGCFKAAFPLVEWRQVSCVTRNRPVPYDPRHGPTPFTVGGNNDYAARVMTGSISGAEGSFDSVTGVTSETGQVGGTGAQVAQRSTNAPTSNTKPFNRHPQACQWALPTRTAWDGSSSSNSSGSGIHIHASTGLLKNKYKAALPRGLDHTRYSPSAPNDKPTAKPKRRTAPRASRVQPITNLRNLSLGASGTTQTPTTSSTILERDQTDLPRP
jgi:hypothetical protein